MSVREPGVHAEFEMFPLLNGLESKSAGREVYTDKPHVRIRVAGYDKDEFFGPATPEIQARFPEEWEAFKRGNEPITHGTPIDRWPQLTPSQVRMLKQLNIRTVEDMASLPDVGLQKVGMGAQKLREAAQKFLSLAQTAADLGRMEEIQAENATLKGQLEALSAQVAELAEKKTRKHASAG